MQTQVHRKAVIVSALLTVFLLATAVGGLFIANRFAATPADAAGNTGAIQPAHVATPQPADNSLERTNIALQQAQTALDQANADLANKDAVIAAYDAQLRDAYTALQQAYGQIEMLQSAQTQPAFGLRGEHERGEHTLTFGDNGVVNND
ncbi:MAG: hypothetical protein KDI12_13775 [Anaerolineae bacterium]|nr:hypothetical protein [Anaerolineae bacterium]HRX04310.1 hypothetical protein [Anaerolineae bacterium]